MEIRDLNYYQQLLNTINGTYADNVLGDLNYSYTTEGVVTPIANNQVTIANDPIEGHNNTDLADTNFTNINDLAAFQTEFLATTEANLQAMNDELGAFLSTVFGVPAGDQLQDLLTDLDFNPSSTMLQYLGEWTPELREQIQRLNAEFEQNQISLLIMNREQAFLDDLDVTNTYNGLGAEEQALFMEILNSYDELVTNYQSEAQNSGIVHIHGHIPEDGLIGDAFSDVNVAAMKLNKAKDMLRMLSEGMSAEDIAVYEKTYDYEIEFNQKLADAVTEYGVGSPQANLLSAQAEAARQTRMYVESVHLMQTSTDALDQAIVAEWERDGFNPLAASIITDMESDIISGSLSSIQALYQGENSKYSLAQDSVTSMRERALKLTNINRDGQINITELAMVLTEAYANNNSIDGISLEVLKAALQANGVTAVQIASVENTIAQIDTNDDGKMDFDEALAAFNSFNVSAGRGAFNEMMRILAATQVDEASNPEAFTTIGDETFFTGDYSTEDRAVLSSFLASNGRYVHTTEEKFEALDAFYENAGNTTAQRADWRDYQFANHAQSHAAGDINQDNSLAWSFKNGLDVTLILEEMEEMTNSRTAMMADLLEIGENVSGSGWWGDLAASYFEMIRDESNVFLVGQRGGSEQDLRLMDMITEALQISYADIGNYHTGINVDINNMVDNVTGEDKVDLKYFADNFDSFASTDIRTDANLRNQANQQYLAFAGLRAALAGNINEISLPESKLIENRLGQLMDIGDQMEAYLLANSALGADARETDAYRALEEQWFNNYDLINGIIRGDESIDKAIEALGGIGADGSIQTAKVNDVLADLQEAIVNGTDPAELDFNSDGVVDSADYDVLRMVVGDRRNESAFDALMTQDSLNLSKMAMYSGLSKNTTSVSATDRSIYSQLETYFSDQSEINNYIASNLDGANFASAEDEAEFMRLANILDELNEAAEFKLRESLGTGTAATLDPELVAAANKVSNQLVLLSLGFSKEESIAITDSFPPSFKITEGLNEGTEMILQFADALKDRGDLDINELSEIVRLAIDENPEDLLESEIIARFGVLNEYIELGANQGEISTYIEFVINDASEDKFNLLDHYIRSGDAYGLNETEEATFFEYLKESSNSNIAQSYLGFHEGNASVASFTLLDDIFEQAGSTRDVLSEDDLRFRQNLNTLFNTYAVNMAMVGGSNYNRIIDNFQNVSIDLLNSVIDGLLEQHINTPQSVILRHGTNSILNALGGVLNDPLASISNENSSTSFLDSALGSNLAVTKDILELQLLILGDMNQNDPAVIAATERAQLLSSWIPDHLIEPDPETEALSTEEKILYNQFLSAFPAGTSPTQAQREAALDLIGGDDFLGDDTEFIANYAGFVASGDSASAEKLVEIAKFYGTGANLSSPVKNISKLNMSAEAVDAAYNLIGSTDSPGLMRDLQALAPGDSAINNLVNGTLSSFLLQTLLNGGSSNAFSAGEGAVTNAFVDALENMVENLQPNSISNNQLASLITKSLGSFTSDLQNNVKVTAASQTEIIKRDTNLSSTYTSETAQLQIDIFNSMIDFYGSQITLENAKDQPNQGKINQYQAQINSHQAAINALQPIAAQATS